MSSQKLYNNLTALPKTNIFLQPVDQQYENIKYTSNSSRFISFFKSPSHTEVENSNDSYSTEDVFSNSSSHDSFALNFCLDELDFEDLHKEEEAVEETKTKKESKRKFTDLLNTKINLEKEAEIAFLKYRKIKLYEMTLKLNIPKEYLNEIKLKCQKLKFLQKIFV